MQPPLRGGVAFTLSCHPSATSSFAVRSTRFFSILSVMALLVFLLCTAYYSGLNTGAPSLLPPCAICAAHRAMRRFRVLSCRGALSCFAPERIRGMRRSGGETAKTASAQCRTRRKSKRQARSSAAADDASPQRRSRAFGREFSWFGPKGPAGQAANAQFQPTNPRFLAAMKNQG